MRSSAQSPVGVITEPGSALPRSLLLAYSLSPAVAKLMGADWLFGVGLLLLAAYFSVCKPATFMGDSTSRRHLMPRLPLTLFVIYGVGLGIALCVMRVADVRAATVGAFNFLVPLLIVSVAGPDRAARMLYDLPFVAVAHAVVALLMYAPLRPPIELIESLSETLLTGTAAFRLSSVSGSLALSSVMVAAFAVAVRRLVTVSNSGTGTWRTWVAAALFLICGFLSLQRAAWLSLAAILLAGLIAAAPNRRIAVMSLLAVLIAPIFAALLLMDIPEDAVDIFKDRFATLTGGSETSAVGERSGQWLNVFQNFWTLPIGHGPGQLGQPVRDFGPVTGGLPIFDGDYFRIVSEYGPVGVALVLILVAGAWRALKIAIQALARRRQRADLVIAAAVLGLLLQCVGTNVTELYFANAVFWSFWLQVWTARKPVFAATNTAPNC